MKKQKKLIDKNGEVRELVASDFVSAKSAKDVLPTSLLMKLESRGPQKAPTKERITIRLSPEVVSTFRATGDGWQTRVDAALQDWLKSHSPV